MAFHRKTGSLISLTNNYRTAQRRYASTEFNNGVVMSDKPLKNNEIFEVRLDKRLNSWSGSVEIGVTGCNPDIVILPASATGLKNGTWIMSGCNILKDGGAVKENYGQDLDKLVEGDTLGVMRTGTGILHFFINGEDQGIASNSIPAGVHAVVDIYGKCTQVTINSVRQLDTNQRPFLANQLANEAIAELTALSSNEILAFHEKCGSLVRLTHENRTAERQRPHGEFNNGVVMTNRPLKQDELFEIRLDTMIDKWSGSIEVGITTHNPSLLEFPATMTNMRSGTIMMSGCGILTNGKGTQREYGQFNLDELAESDRIGLIRKRNGNLHFYINSIDQGIAAENAPEIVWGVVDLYGMAVKVTILDEMGLNEEEESSGLTTQEHHVRPTFAPHSLLSTRPDHHYCADSDTDSSEISSSNADEASTAAQADISGDALTFHPVCGRNVSVINRNLTAVRPHAHDDFNYAVVLSNRPLLPDEQFEIQIGKVIDKWAGSVELGVTVHDPMSLEFPAVMSNVQAGTWVMTANGIMHNNETVIEDYGYRPDRMKAGDRVGVVRKSNGNLFFTVNGQNLGLAATNVPEGVYGVLDLYGQAVEASIVQPGDATCSDLRFHPRHGSNCLVLNELRSAARPRPREDYNDAIVMSNRPLRPSELFEVVIDKMVDRWSGSLDCGVTTLNPDTMDFPCTMTDFTPPGTWILSGCSIVQEGSMTRSRYNCDLEQLETGSRIGILVTADRSLHFFLNGVDQGVACTGLASSVYAVVDLYGTCAGVSITSNTGMYEGQRIVRHCEMLPRPSKNQLNERRAASAANHRFSYCCGMYINLLNEQTTAARVKNFNNGIVFSADPIKTDELFEIRVDQVGRQWSGSLMLGFTTQTVSESQLFTMTEATALELHSKTKSTWIVNGPKVLHNGEVITENYSPALDRLEVGSRVGIRRCQDATMHVYVNGKDLGVAATHIPRNVFLIVDVYGAIESVSIISQTKNSRLHNESQCASEPQQPITTDEQYDIDTRDTGYTFHPLTAKNIQLSNKDTTARRITGYNQAIVVSAKPLTTNNPFMLNVDKLHSKWSSSLMFGVTAQSPGEITAQSPGEITCLKSALNLTRSTWLIKSTSVFHNARKILSSYCPDLNALHSGSTLSLSLDNERSLHLYINGIDAGVAARCLPDPCYPIVDLYGQCHQVSIANEDDHRQSTSKEDKEKADMDNGIKEKIRPPLNMHCAYHQLCDRFKLCISLPDEFFKAKYNKCFCDTCHKLRAGAIYRVRGNPAREYSVPLGWYRYGLKVRPRVKSLKIFDNWNVAYSGVKVESIRKILDSGDLLSVADSCSRHINQQSCAGDGEEKKPDTFESVPVILSPSVRYAACPHFTQPVEYRDAKTDKLYQVRFAFEACIKPGSFNVGPQTLDTPDSQDPKLNTNEIEWATKERASVEIYGLLLRLDPL